MIFGTQEGTTIIFPGTGTGGWESALTNTLSPGDKVRSWAGWDMCEQTRHALLGTAHHLQCAGRSALPHSASAFLNPCPQTCPYRW